MLLGCYEILRYQMIWKKKVKKALEDNKELAKLMDKSTFMKVDDLGMARFWDRLCVPSNKNLRKSIPEETHRSKFSVYPQMIMMH